MLDDNQKDASIRVESESLPSEARASRSLVRWEPAARAAWWVITLTVIAMTVASISILYRFLLTVCPRATWCDYQLNALQIQELENLGFTLPLFAAYFSVLLPLVPFFCFFVAFLLFFHKSVGWIGLLGAYTLVLIGGLAFPVTAELILSAYPALQLPIIILTYAGIILFPIFFIVFPDGQVNPRWSLTLVIVWAIFSILSIFIPESSTGNNTWSGWFQELFRDVLFCSLILVQYYRYRRIYGPVLRQQTKWVVYGLMVALGGSTAVRLVYLLAPTETQEAVLIIILVHSVAYLVMALIPISIALAIFRYRLWDIDLLINRTLVYIPLTGILGGLYSATVVLFQKIFIATTGAKSDVALVLSTFVLAATFTPVKNGLQQAVDKRFKEPVDPYKEIIALDNEVRSVVEVLDAGLITRRLLNTATKAFHATGGAVYLERNGQMVEAQATPGWSEADRQVSLVLEWNGRKIGLLDLGEREGGIEYSARECQVLQQAANRVARVVAGFGGEMQGRE